MDNLEERDTGIADLHLDDETIRILKSGTINNRLFCEIIMHPAFPNLLSDIEIYVDNLAGSWIHNMNLFVSFMRNKIKTRTDAKSDDYYLKTLEKSEVVRMCNILDINLTKYTPEEHQVLMYLIRKGSRNSIFKNPPKGRGKKK